ncbi:MAG: hypothetical protein ABLT11_11015 [Candidatus Acidiferrum sp.]
MISVTVSILAAVLLLFILFRVWKSTCLPDEESPFGLDGADEWAACPRDIVTAIFSDVDQEYVSKFDSPQLRSAFLRERKSVARAWVRATAGSIHRIMREHAQIARQSSDLDISDELGLYARYLSLQAACAGLQLSIGLVGPTRVRYLSEYVYALSARLSYAHWALKDAMESRELQGMWQG